MFEWQCKAVPGQWLCTQAVREIAGHEDMVSQDQAQETNRDRDSTGSEKGH